MSLNVIKTQVIILKNKKINLQWSGRINLPHMSIALIGWVQANFPHLGSPQLFSCAKYSSNLSPHKLLSNLTIGDCHRDRICDCTSCTLLLRACINLPSPPNCKARNMMLIQKMRAKTPSSSQWVCSSSVEDAKEKLHLKKK